MFHVKHSYASLLEALDLQPTEPRLRRLDTYEELLRTRALPLGMVAHFDAERLPTRHVGDSLRGAPLLAGVRSAADLGSGAGLPGIPLAIVTEQTAWLLLEQRRRRVAFLELVIAELGLDNVDVVPGNAEHVGRRVEAVVARAFAEPTRAWEVAAPLLADDGRLLYWAGAGFEPERDGPDGVSVRLVTSAVAGAGPIAIMTQQ